MIIINIISIICTVISIFGAIKSWRFSKKAQNILNRDSLIMSINELSEIKNVLIFLRKNLNETLSNNLKRGKNIELLLNNQIEKLKKTISLIFTNIPVQYQEIFKVGETDYIKINQIIAHMLGNHREITDENLDDLEEYFIELEIELKKANELETKKI